MDTVYQYSTVTGDYTDIAITSGVGPYVGALFRP
jgi:hypothetical protein